LFKILTLQFAKLQIVKYRKVLSSPRRAILIDKRSIARSISTKTTGK